VGGGEGGVGVGKGGSRWKRGEMTQTLYAHMNKKQTNKRPGQHNLKKVNKGRKKGEITLLTTQIMLLFLNILKQ
jgi:hypothetical protein